MDTRNTINITINGRKYKLSGEESPAYMQKAADFVDSVYDELRTIPGFTSRSTDYQNLMMYLNMADRYLKKTGWDEERQAVEDQKAKEELEALQTLFALEKEKSEAALKEAKEQYEQLAYRMQTLTVERNRLADREREGEGKITVLEKEAASHRTEISILKRKVNDFVKSTVELERQIRSLKENGDPALVEALKDELSRVKAASENESAALRKSFEDKIAKLEAEAEDQMIELRAEYENKMADMKPGYENLLTEQENEYKTLQAEKDAVWADQVTALEEKLKLAEEKLASVSDTKAEEMKLEMKNEMEEKLASQAKAYEEKLAAMQAEMEAALKKTEAVSDKSSDASELEKKLMALTKENEEYAARLSQMENDMIEYCDLIDDKDREIARLRFYAEEGEYED